METVVPSFNLITAISPIEKDHVNDFTGLLFRQYGHQSITGGIRGEQRVLSLLKCHLSTLDS
jgi:hypothetical protein